VYGLQLSGGEGWRLFFSGGSAWMALRGVLKETSESLVKSKNHDYTSNRRKPGCLTRFRADYFDAAGTLARIRREHL